MDIATILNLVVITLLSLISFLGIRLFKTNDKQYDLLLKLNDTIHDVDKRVVVVETTLDITHKMVL